jgi:hypothetical protein
MWELETWGFGTRGHGSFGRGDAGTVRRGDISPRPCVSASQNPASPYYFIESPF